MCQLAIVMMSNDVTKTSALMQNILLSNLSSLPCLILVADQVAQKPPSSAPIIVNFCRIKSNDWRDVDYNCPETVPRLITRVWMAHDIKVLNTSMHSSSQGLTQKKCKITLVRNPFWPFLKKSSWKAALSTANFWKTKQKWQKDENQMSGQCPCHNSPSATKHQWDTWWLWLPVAERLNIDVENQMTKREDTGRWQCLTCGYEASLRGRLWDHVESTHVVTSGYPCEICRRIYPSKNAYKSHKSRYHRDLKTFSW